MQENYLSLFAAGILEEKTSGRFFAVTFGILAVKRSSMRSVFFSIGEMRALSLDRECMMLLEDVLVDMFNNGLVLMSGSLAGGYLSCAHLFRGDITGSFVTASNFSNNIAY